MRAHNLAHVPGVAISAESKEKNTECCPEASIQSKEIQEEFAYIGKVTDKGHGC